MYNVGKWVGLVVLLCLQSSLCLAAPEEDEPDWFDEDPDAIFNAINEGQLNFLEKLPEKPVHHHHNTLIVRASSIQTGWVKLIQCHENLDEFPSAQIVYNRNKIRNLRLTSFKNIGNAWVEGSSVQLKNIAGHASLCIEAESQALRPQADGSYLMKNGPFMRKFLDGYFPMRVSMEIKLPDNLVFVAIEPKEQKGFRVVKGKQGIHFDAWFEGRLETRIKFQLQTKN
jgi:hypothetical protein